MTTIITGIVLFCFGACLGSFASALQHRIKTGKGEMLTGRSACPGCDHTLLWYHMVPIISWLALSGKCGFCHKKIGVRYVLLEIFFGAVFSGVGLFLLQTDFFRPITFAIILMIIFVMLFLAVYDGLYQEVPDTVVVSMTIIFFVLLVADIFVPHLYQYVRPLFGMTLVEGLIAAVLFYSFFAFQNLLAGLLYFREHKQIARLPGFIVGFGMLPFWWTIKAFIGEKKADSLFPSLDAYEDVPGWVGGGDFRYAIFLGLVSGLYMGFVSLIIGYIIGGLFGCILLLQGRRNTYVPLIPFLACGWFVALILMTKI